MNIYMFHECVDCQLKMISKLSFITRCMTPLHVSHNHIPVVIN
uniref:Uncharacterized protein n=1 Tax=Arundo donax TaxID=35708 RepID=A0A0A9EQ50_ARUDO